jgi:hypothetical protein
MRELPIIATLHRKRKVVKSRRYARIDTAIKRQSQLAVIEGEPKDVIEFSHAHTGLQIGTIRVGVGEFKAEWVWDNVPQLSGVEENETDQV